MTSQAFIASDQQLQERADLESLSEAIQFDGFSALCLKQASHHSSPKNRRSHCLYVEGHL